MAPEVLRSSKKDNRHYGSKCDMWSIGVICYALLCGRLPIDADPKLPDKDQQSDLLDRIVRFDADTDKCFTERCFTELDDLPKLFLRKLLVHDPKKRYSAKQAMDDEWIERFWEQTLDHLRKEIDKHKGNLGESITIKCLKSLKEFKKTVHEDDDEKVFFDVQDQIIDEMTDILGAE